MYRIQLLWGCLKFIPPTAVVGKAVAREYAWGGGIKQLATHPSRTAFAAFPPLPPTPAASWACLHVPDWIRDRVCQSGTSKLGVKGTEAVRGRGRQGQEAQDCWGGRPQLRLWPWAQAGAGTAAAACCLHHLGFKSKECFFPSVTYGEGVSSWIQVHAVSQLLKFRLRSVSLVFKNMGLIVLGSLGFSPKLTKTRYLSHLNKVMPAFW